MLKKMNLQIKMLLYIGMVAFLSFAVTIGVVAVKAGKMAKQDAMEKTTEIAHHYGGVVRSEICLLYTSPSPRDVEESRMPSSA